MMGLALGAAVGAGSAALQHKDILQGALLGGVTGAVTGGIGSLAGAGAGTSALAGGLSDAGIAANSVNAFEAGLPGMTEGSIGAATPVTQGGLDTLQANQLMQTPVNQSVAPGFDALKEDPMKYLGEHKFQLGASALAGGMAPSGQTQQQIDQGSIRPYTYNQNMNPGYTGSGSPYFNQSYTPGSIQKLADGGIAGLANGGNLGQNPMYPMSQMDHTQYATPSQLPTSAQVVDADYDAKTNPMTGQEVVRMAEGGDTLPATGATTYTAPDRKPSQDVIDYNNMLAQRAHQEYIANSAPAAFTPRAVPLVPVNPALTTAPGIGSLKNYNGSDINAQNIGQAYRQMYGTDVPSGLPDLVQKTYDPTQNSMYQVMRDWNTMNPSKNYNPTQAANGGVMGNQYNLGSYSDGGRLLKGPGDGVSDDIPAQIGHKQPARLADGEFVVPARIVSELGNGSTDAGAKRLYAMMDRIQANRKKTIGKDNVAVNSRSDQYLPA
jgi:hypothetical protein